MIGIFADKLGGLLCCAIGPTEVANLAGHLGASANTVTFVHENVPFFITPACQEGFTPPAPWNKDNIYWDLKSCVTTVFNHGIDVAFKMHGGQLDRTAR